MTLLRRVPGSRAAISLALAAALLAPVVPRTVLADPAPSKLDRRQAGYYRLQIGDVHVTALSDGTVPIDASRLTNVAPARRDALLAQAFLSSPLDASVNAFLVELGSRRVLIDAGAAELYGPTLGKLPDVLRAIGTPPEQITDILLTHIHTDHSGGLMEGQRMAFPNAIVHVDQRELAFWLDPDARPTNDDERRLFDEARRKVKPYVDAGKVRTFTGPAQLFAGLRAKPAPGHTPGHTFYVLESRGQTLEFWGDVLHVADVQLPEPSVTIQFDVDSPAAARQRARAFAEAAHRGYLVAPAHMSFPGIGHLRADAAGGYRWVPLPWVDDALPAVR